MKTRIIAALVLVLSLISCQSNPEKDQLRFYIGSYAEQSEEGIFSAQLNLKNSSIEVLSTYRGIKNPSFLGLDPTGKFLYAVSEVDDYEANSKGGVFSFRIASEDAALSLINAVQSGGAHPCHLDIHPSGDQLFVANYTGGNISSVSIGSSGELLSAVQTIQHLGSGPNKARQEKPHAHSVNLDPNGRFLYACDLGIDQVMGYNTNLQSAKINPHELGTLALTPGAGPRHMAFNANGKLAFVINELNSTITSCTINPETGTIEAVASTSTLPADYFEENYCADIHVHPKKHYLYASNRGHNSIAVFAIDNISGAIEPIQYQSTLGDWPRNFAIDPSGQYLVVANQRSDNVVLFKINQNTGHLVETGTELSVKKPVCIVFEDQN